MSFCLQHPVFVLVLSGSIESCGHVIVILSSYCCQTCFLIFVLSLLSSSNRRLIIVAWEKFLLFLLYRHVLGKNHKHQPEPRQQQTLMHTHSLTLSRSCLPSRGNTSSKGYLRVSRPHETLMFVVGSCLLFWAVYRFLGSRFTYTQGVETLG